MSQEHRTIAVTTEPTGDVLRQPHLRAQSIHRPRHVYGTTLGLSALDLGHRSDCEIVEKDPMGGGAQS